MFGATKVRVVQLAEIPANLGALAGELANLPPASPANSPPTTRHSPPPDAKLKEELYALEEVIGAYKTSWVSAGAALRDVCDRAVYRWKHDTFEEYLRARWGWKKRTAYDLITAAGVAENVREVRHALGVSAALKLAKLPAEQQAECLRQVIAATGTRNPQAKDLAAAVVARRIELGLLPARKRTAKKTKKPKPWRLRLAGGVLTILAKPGADLRRLLQEALVQLAKEEVRS